MVIEGTGRRPTDDASRRSWEWFGLGALDDDVSAPEPTWPADRFALLTERENLEASVKKRIVVLVLAVAGFVLGAAGPAMASNWATAQYDADGNYIGCVSKATGEHLDVTELGCNTDVEAA